MDNNRVSARHRVYKTGKIIFNERRSVVDCVVKDLSGDGAKLKLSAAIALPQEFDLLLVSEQKSFKVRRIWKRGELVGVRFF